MKKNLTPIATAVALLVLASGAMAQQADTKAAKKGEETAEKVVIAGVRASLEQSMNQKRSSDARVEVITSEDIGKMPDKNVADSLQRLPGVSVATAGGTEGGFGENDRVSMRGTPSSLTLTTINGHSISSGDWLKDNVAGSGRSVSYSLLPSEIIGRVTVYKSSQADLVEGGVSGSVDIQTRKPLDFKNQVTATGSATLVNSSLAGKTDPQLSGLVSWKNDQNTIGFLAQAFSEKRHLRRDGQEFLWWDKPENLWGKNMDFVNANPALKGKSISLLTGSSLFLQERQRKGGLMELQFKPTNDFSFSLNGFYTRLDATNSNSNYMLAMHRPIVDLGLSPTSYTVSGNTVTSISFPATCAGCATSSSGVNDMVARDGSYSDSKYVNLDFKYKFTPDFDLTGKFGVTKGAGNAVDAGIEVWTPWTGGGYTTNGTNGPAAVSLPGSNKYSVGGLTTDVGGYSPSKTTSADREEYFQLDGTANTNYDLFPIVRVGVRGAKHLRTLTSMQGQVSAAGALPSAVPTGSLTSYPSNYGLGGGMLTGVWSLPVSAVSAWARQNVSFVNHNYAAEFNVDENVTASYIMSDIQAGKVSGNFGLRIASTKEKVTNFDSTGKPAVIESSYDDYLPSLNLKMDVNKDVVVRFSANRTMTRPDFGQMGGLVLKDIQRTASGGNANLKPIRSNNLDVGAEWYFAPKSMVSAGVYLMKMGSYVTFGETTRTFYNFAEKKDTVYTMSAPINTTAEVKGLELNYIQALAGGFGVNANYTYANGKETSAAPKSACAMTGNCDMVGTSKNTYNLGTYFENDDFSARVNYSYRSTFLNGIDRKSAIYQAGVGSLSVSFAYNINKNLAVTLEGKDLNNPMLKSYAASEDQPRAFYKNGRQVYLGLRAKM